VPALFALDQNFPQPIVEGLRDWLEADAELTPIADIHREMATLDDWQVLLALHTDRRSWDRLITTDRGMLNLPRELTVPCQTKVHSRGRRCRGSRPNQGDGSGAGSYLQHLPADPPLGFTPAHA
jgi:hypothetical protein